MRKYAAACVVVMLTLVSSLRSIGPGLRRITPQRLQRDTVGATSLHAQDENADGAFAKSFVAQKNFILLEKLENPEDGDYAATAMSYVNFCDESFNAFLNDRIAAADSPDEKQRLGKVRYEINSARQKKLMEADKLLRGILASGGLKQIEAKLAFHLRRAEIDMAFMVILELNIEDALNNKVEKAVQVLTHMKTLINEHQDDVVSAPVKLMRLLMRTDDQNIRKQMLRQKLLIGDNVAQQEMTASAAVRDDSSISSSPSSPSSPSSSPAATAVTAANVDRDGVPIAGDTTVPQCEHIVIPGVATWGGADVQVQELRDTIMDVLAQMSEIGGDPDTLLELEAKCSTLRLELEQVLYELTVPKVSDQVENCSNLEYGE
jgi:hypothetical protein